ncbi:YEATS domain-containing protein 2-like [Physella acuta]|uniref:YEATS domain-containing protein 2-like n=1 Tax=Physella acuta TaxID=109671 RepID=UPI0027DB919F|nr:YEATS domain-containing protein 2-like [Physella acuta]
MTKMSNQKRTFEEVDPDYVDVDEQQTKRQRALEEDAKQAVSRRIQNIVKNEFQREINSKESELQLVDRRLNEARLMMDRLRACIVANYYGQVNQSGSSQVSSLNAPPPSIHPAVKKYIGKAPCDQDGNSAWSSSQHQTEAMDTDSCLDKERAKRVCNGTDPSISKQFQATPSSSLHKSGLSEADGYDDRRARFKIKRKIIVGNISKYIPVDHREANDMSSHKWMMYVRGPRSDPDISHFVKKVWFFLHHSYKPNDLVEVSSPPFHLTRRGWGEFPVRVQLHFIDSRNKKVDIIHHLKLDKTFTGLQTPGAETIVEVELERDFFENGVSTVSSNASLCMTGHTGAQSYPISSSPAGNKYFSAHKPAPTKSSENMTVTDVCSDKTTTSGVNGVAVRKSVEVKTDKSTAVAKNRKTTSSSVENVTIETTSGKSPAQKPPSAKCFDNVTVEEDLTTSSTVDTMLCGEQGGTQRTCSSVDEHVLVDHDIADGSLEMELKKENIELISDYNVTIAHDTDENMVDVGSDSVPVSSDNITEILDTSLTSSVANSRVTSVGTSAIRTTSSSLMPSGVRPVNKTNNVLTVVRGQSLIKPAVRTSLNTHTAAVSSHGTSSPNPPVLTAVSLLSNRTMSPAASALSAEQKVTTAFTVINAPSGINRPTTSLLAVKNSSSLLTQVGLQPGTLSQTGAVPQTKLLTKTGALAQSGMLTQTGMLSKPGMLTQAATLAHNGKPLLLLSSGAVSSPISVANIQQTERSSPNIQKLIVLNSSATPTSPAGKPAAPRQVSLLTGRVVGPQSTPTNQKVAQSLLTNSPNQKLVLNKATNQVLLVQQPGSTQTVNDSIVQLTSSQLHHHIAPSSSQPVSLTFVSPNQSLQQPVKQISLLKNFVVQQNVSLVNQPTPPLHIVTHSHMTNPAPHNPYPKMSAVGVTKHGRNHYKTAGLSVEKKFPTEEERKKSQYEVLRAFKENPELYDRHSLKSKKLLPPARDRLEGEADEIPPLIPTDYPNLTAMLKVACRLHPLIQAGVNRLTHPYCAESLEQWNSWQVGKQRACEWHRACFVNRYLQQCLGNRTDFCGERLMTTRQLVNWCRLHAFSPCVVEKKQPVRQEMKPENWTSYTPVTEIMSKLSDLTAACAGGVDDEIDVTNSDDVPKVNLAKQDKDQCPLVPQDNDQCPAGKQDNDQCSLNVQWIEPTEGAIFVYDELRKRGQRLRPTELVPGVVALTAAEMVFKAMLEFTADVLRESLSVNSQSPSCNGTLTRQDVHVALSNLPEASFCCSRFLGKEEEEDVAGTR